MELLDTIRILQHRADLLGQRIARDGSRDTSFIRAEMAALFAAVEYLSGQRSKAVENAALKVQVTALAARKTAQARELDRMTRRLVRARQIAESP